VTSTERSSEVDSTISVANLAGTHRARRVVVAWFALPLFGAVWAIRRLRHSYFFYDEWSMIDRVVHLPLWTGMTASFNGHLWLFQDLFYRIQVSWFGVNNHVFVSAVFVLSLVALHIAMAAVLERAGVPPVMSLCTGGLLTYLGAASQNFIFAIQASPCLALATGLAAAALALARPPTIARSIVAAAMMVLSVAFDSGIALTTITFATAVLALSWRGRYALAVLPSLIAMSWWYLTGDLGPVDDASLAIKARFAGHLLLHSLGALFGQGEGLGVVVAVLATATLGIGLARGWVAGAARTTLIAGALSTVVTTSAIAHARATTVGANFIDFNRYLQNVLIPFALSALPAVYSIVRSAPAGWRERHPAMRGALGPLVVAAAFLLGLSPLRAYIKNFEAWNVAVRDGVRDAAAVITDGCPSGAPPDPRGQPMGGLSPQISTELLRELVRRGALRAGDGAPIDQAVVDRMCSENLAIDAG